MSKTNWIMFGALAVTTWVFAKRIRDLYGRETALHQIVVKGAPAQPWTWMPF